MFERLIERCIAKDRDAWRQFIRKFESVVSISIRTKLSRYGFPFNEEDVKDISQSVFLDIWQKEKLVQVRDRKRIKGWLSIVSQNASIDFMRRNSSRSRFLSLSEEGFREEDLLKQPCGGNTLEVAEGNELQHIVDTFVSQLPEKHRIVLSLSLLHSQTHREIAAILKMKISSVSAIIAREKKRLRGILRKKGYLECK